MSHYDKIPQLLDNLITCSVAEACRRVGITPQTFWGWLVKSRLGDPKFQEIEFCTVVAPLHVQYQNAKMLIGQQISQSAYERARDGVYVDVFFQGQRQFEKVKKPQYADCDDDDIELILGKDHVDEAYELKPTKQWLKPSDALTLRMLEAHDKRFRSHQEISVQYGGVLRIDRPEERTTETVTHAPVFEEDADDTERGAQLALARPAKSDEELDKWAAAGEFEPQPVRFTNAKGEEMVLEAERKQVADDPLLNHPRAYDARTGQKPAPPPTPVGKATQPLDSAGTGRGTIPPGGFKMC